MHTIKEKGTGLMGLDLSLARAKNRFSQAGRRWFHLQVKLYKRACMVDRKTIKPVFNKVQPIGCLEYMCLSPCLVDTQIILLYRQLPAGQGGKVAHSTQETE